MINNINSRCAGALYAALVVVLFSSFVLVSRAGLSSALKLHDVAVLRFGIGAIVLFPLMIGTNLVRITIGQVLILAALGGLGFGLLAYAGFALAPASHGGVLIHGTLALTTAILARFHLSHVNAGRGIGLAIIALGVAAIIFDARSSSSWTWVGDLSLLGASFCWSAYGLYVRRLGIPAVQAAGLVAITSALIFVPIYIVLPGKMLLHADWRDVIIQAAFQGVLIGAVSIYVYTRAVHLIGPARVSLVTATVPGLTVVGGMLFLGEVPTNVATIGISAVTIGMVLSLILDKQSPIIDEPEARS